MEIGRTALPPPLSLIVSDECSIGREVIQRVRDLMGAVISLKQVVKGSNKDLQ